MTSGRPINRRFLPSSPFNKPAVPESPPEQFAVDDRVTHDRYGMGTVLRLEGSAEVIVDFGAEVRRIAIPNPKLIKL